MPTHNEVIRNAFATSQRLKVEGSGDQAIIQSKDESLAIDISKTLVQNIEITPRLTHIALHTGMDIYFYAYKDILTVMW